MFIQKYKMIFYKVCNYSFLFTFAKFCLLLSLHIRSINRCVIPFVTAIISIRIVNNYFSNVSKVWGRFVLILELRQLRKKKKNLLRWGFMNMSSKQQYRIKKYIFQEIGHLTFSLISWSNSKQFYWVKNGRRMASRSDD